MSSKPQPEPTKDLDESQNLTAAALLEIKELRNLLTKSQQEIIEKQEALNLNQ